MRTGSDSSVGSPQYLIVSNDQRALKMFEWIHFNVQKCERT